ncbi:hypothetical protein Sjap_025906 [Stephania japonica]|uniref:Uncharacterized protein n=1 Tax=Stephania japonica TaxID=461633 RepID=A0AAP0E2H5_9MAGN
MAIVERDVAPVVAHADGMNAGTNKKGKGKGNGKGKEKKKSTKSNCQDELLTSKIEKISAPTRKSVRLNTHRALNLPKTTYENPFIIDDGGEKGPTAESMCMQKSIIDILKSIKAREATFMEREPLITHRINGKWVYQPRLCTTKGNEKRKRTTIASTSRKQVKGFELVDEEEYEVGMEVLSDDKTDDKGSEDEVQGDNGEEGIESKVAEEEVADVKGREDGADGYEHGVYRSDEEDVPDHGNFTWMGHSIDYDSFHGTTSPSHTKKQIHEQMDEQIHDQMDEHMDKQVKEWMDELVEEVHEGAANLVGY